MFQTRYAKVGVYICYDRHFPEGARCLGLNGAEIVFNPSATVAGLSQYLWKLEQPAHAVANGYYVGAINRVGTEAPWNIGKFYGTSYFVNPRGKIVAEASEDNDELVVADLDLDLIDEVRDTWQFFRDRRPETYGAAHGALSGKPAIRRVVETALYVDDMARAVAFYRDVLGLRVMGGNDRLTPVDAGGGTVLLLFRRGGTAAGIPSRAGSSRRTTGQGRPTSPSRSTPTRTRRGGRASPGSGSPWKPRITGTGAGAACTFATPTGTRWSWRPRDSGKRTERQPLAGPGKILPRACRIRRPSFVARMKARRESPARPPSGRAIGPPQGGSPCVT